ncbi:hypothetical protein [Pyrobaculum aerophilum]|uniref:TFIIB-type domain-containing protein n=1 Tax=Pyrobaculum aerophilum TaxID=13773 RepID=A0A371R475_9CREN|nr:hypothetical protein [Pyrobaculum aerophilum]RFA96189.1 hypothetical protein CGL51_05865 [Pyrobaculum aerophilum]RFA98596.1 hypothetical protein CGL52_06655 [Pyrobaculum aerophilum]
MECPQCGGVAVYNGVEYVCGQCGLVLGVEYVALFQKAVKVVKRKAEGEREWRRHLALRKAAITTAIKVPTQMRVQWTPPSKRVERWIWTLCYRLDIPPIQCAKAAEAFRKVPRVVWQGPSLSTWLAQC